MNICLLLILFTFHLTNTIATIEEMEKLLDSKVKLLKIADKKEFKYWREKKSVRWETKKKAIFNKIIRDTRAKN